MNLTISEQENSNVNISVNKLISSFKSMDNENLKTKKRLKNTKNLIVKMLSKRSLSVSQLLRVARKYDENLSLGLIEQAVHELMVYDVIDEVTADKFILIA